MMKPQIPLFAAQGVVLSRDPSQMTLVKLQQIQFFEEVLQINIQWRISSLNWNRLNIFVYLNNYNFRFLPFWSVPYNIWVEFAGCNDISGYFSSGSMAILKVKVGIVIFIKISVSISITDRVVSHLKIGWGWIGGVA